MATWAINAAMNAGFAVSATLENGSYRSGEVVLTGFAALSAAAGGLCISSSNRHEQAAVDLEVMRAKQHIEQPEA